MPAVQMLVYTLLIDRDASNKLPVQVPEYERVILEEIYGEEFVQEISSETVTREDFDLGMAYEGLVQRYRANPEADAARARYFNRARDLERFIQTRQPAGGAKAKASSKAKDKGQDVDAQPQGQPSGGIAEGGRKLDDAAVAELLEGTIPEIEAKLADLSDADLAALEAAETEGKGRVGLLSAIDDENEKRKA